MIYSHEAQESVLGFILFDTSNMETVMQYIKAPEAFYGTEHQQLFSDILEVYNKGQSPDMIKISSVSNYSPADLADLTDKANGNLDQHCQIVVEFYVKRLAMDSTQKILQNDDPFDLVESLYSLSDELNDILSIGISGTVELSKSITEEIKRLKDLENKEEGELMGVPSGFHFVDHITGGWQPSDLIILAARPGMGKSAFMVCSAINAAKAGHPVAIASLEMSITQLTQRSISANSEVPLENMRRGNVGSEIDKIIKTSNVKGVYMIDKAGMHLNEFRAWAKKMVRSLGVKLLFVDYLQLMQGEKGGNRETEVSSIARGLKQVAKDLNVPVIALAQLSRAVENRGGDMKPKLSDLRESGAIEQDADIVSFLYRPQYYDIHDDGNGNSLNGLAQVIFAKHRNGRLDNAWLKFQPEYVKLLNVDTLRDELPSRNGNYKEDGTPF